MRKLMLFTALASLVGACGPRKNEPLTGARGPVTGIVNGEEVGKGDPHFASTVALVIRERISKQVHICSGTLLKSNAILTAAHCFAGDVGGVVAVFGSDVANAPKEKIRIVPSVVTHGVWTETIQNPGDMALAFFDGGVPAGHKPARLLPPSVELKKGAELVVAGYGVTNAKPKSGEGFLRKARTTLISQLGALALVIDGSRRGICYGDSGGPVYAKYEGKIYLAGVNHGVIGEACDNINVATYVVPFLGWIDETLSEFGGGRK